MPTQELQLNEFQERLLAVPEQFDLALLSGRGGGKSYGMAYLALRHAELYDTRARILYLRKTYRGLADFELVTREIFGTIYGTAAKYNLQEHTWRFPNGAYMELGQLESHSDYSKYQGRSFNLILIDEAGQFASPDLIDLMRSNLRAAKDVPKRMVIAGNAGGAGHHWLSERLAMRGTPWQPFVEPKTKRSFVLAPSTFRQNPYLDPDEYQDQLVAACGDDDALLEAWVTGSWAAVRGAFFASVLSETRSAVDHWTAIPKGGGWSNYLSMDWGSSAPAVVFLCAKSPGTDWEGKWYPRGSTVLVDEFHTARRGDWSKGMNWVVPQVSDGIKAMCERWHVPARGVADDACWSRTGAEAGSLADEFKRAGVYFEPAHKGTRARGWETMRRMLADAGKVDKPGLYASRACHGFWTTLPILPRDDRHPDDVDSGAIDHWADAARYALLTSTLTRGVKVKFTC
jgi:hypothetical protein